MFDWLFGNPVDRLVAARTRHLSVFSRLVAKLEALHAKMSKEVEVAQERIKDQEEEIRKQQEKIVAHKNMIDVLEKEKINTLNTKAKISNLVGEV